MKIQKNNSQRNLLEVRNLITTVEKKLSTFGDKKVIIEKLEPSELEDLYKILTMCELVLVKYESKKTTYQHYQHFYIENYRELKNGRNLYPRPTILAPSHTFYSY